MNKWINVTVKKSYSECLHVHYSVEADSLQGLVWSAFEIKKTKTKNKQINKKENEERKQEREKKKME